MNKEDYIAQGKKVHTLQIDKSCFQAILKGEQKVEHRYIYPSNVSRYVYFEANGKDYKSQNDIPEDVTEITVVPIWYDALYLINGRKKEAPRMLVEVEKVEYVIITDEDGNDMTYEENGEEYLVCQVWYYLGKVLGTENVL